MYQIVGITHSDKSLAIVFFRKYLGELISRIYTPLKTTIHSF